MSKLKAASIWFLALSLFSTFVSAQNSSSTSKSIEELKTKFAVPDAPAFTILDENPSNILKPASVKDIAIVFSSFLDNKNQLSLPKSFAAEFSPGLLISGRNLTIREYRENKWLYRLRLSVGTSRPGNAKSATNLAFGIRMTLNDESDPRTNDEYLLDATKLSEQIQGLVDERRRTLGPTATMFEIENDQELIAEKKKLVDKFKENWFENKWNKNISELAIAIKTASKDSLAHNLELSKVSFWFTAAYAYGDWGQFLIGVNANSERNMLANRFKTSGSIAARFYAGTNNYKIYVQFEGSLIEESKTQWMFNSGLELKIQENIWAEFTAGILNNDMPNSGSLVTDFKLKYGI